tara:strand:- start:191 stop:412 length:222 start_codon:yes stop_codon:yes gene_type:complete
MKRKELIAKLDELGVEDNEDIMFLVADHYSNVEDVEDSEGGEGGSISVMRRHGSSIPQIKLNVFFHRLVRRGS